MKDKKTLPTHPPDLAGKKEYLKIKLLVDRIEAIIDSSKKSITPKNFLIDKSTSSKITLLNNKKEVNEIGEEIVKMLNVIIEYNKYIAPDLAHKFHEWTSRILTIINCANEMLKILCEKNIEEGFIS